MTNTVRIKVIGLGRDGGSYISKMLNCNIEGVEFIHIDADSNYLYESAVPIKLLIGANVTPSLGSGNPDINKQAAEESFQEIYEVLQGADIVILMYRLSCAVSSGAGPIIAKAAQSVGAVTIGIMSSNVGIEGRMDSGTAYYGLNALRNSAGTFIIFPSYKMADQFKGDKIFSHIHKCTCDILCNALNTLINIIISGDDSHIKYSDLKSLISNGGFASMGLGRYDYRDKGGFAAVGNATRIAMFSPFLEIPLYRSRSVISIVSSSSEVSKGEINRVTDLISQVKGSTSDILCGSTINNEMGENTIEVMLIAL